MLVLVLPRSVRLAAWGTAVLADAARLEDAVRAVTGDDEPHRVEGAGVDPDPAPGGLAALVGGWREAGVRGLRVVLPVPGDALGLPGPADFNRAALQAGECVLTVPGPATAPQGVLPRVTAFGSAWEPGAMVDWTVHRVAPTRITVLGSLAEAERELREALITATETLARLDLARWRPDAAERISAVRQAGLSAGALPPSASGRAVRVLVSAARVRAIVDLAAEDDGGSTTGHDVRQRARTLRELDGVCRQAMAAAISGLGEARSSDTAGR